MIYLVNQGKTWKQERAGGFLWSPQVDKAGHQNAGYALMQNVKKGDYILHNKGGQIAAISIAKANCYAAIQPEEVRENSGTYDWDDCGFRIDTEYYDFTVPLLNSDLAQWSKLHPQANSCFQSDGKLKLRYLCNVAEPDARHMINEALRLERDPQVKAVLYDAVTSIECDQDEYDDDDAVAIDSLVGMQNGTKKYYSGKLKQPQMMTDAAGSVKAKPKRNPQIAANALGNAGYVCEFDPADRTFLRKRSKKPYTEPHHLIPISRYKDFPYSVDVEENIVSLCSHCHNLLHYGCMKDKEVILRKLYEARKAGLEESGMRLDFEQLKSYYK